MQNDHSKFCQWLISCSLLHLPILEIVCCEWGKLTFHMSLTWKTFFCVSDRSMYPFKLFFSLSAKKKKIDEDALDTISIASVVRGNTWTFREESRRSRILVCFASEKRTNRLQFLDVAYKIINSPGVDTFLRFYHIRLWVSEMGVGRELEYIPVCRRSMDCTTL